MDIYKRRAGAAYPGKLSLLSHLMNSKSACWEPGSRPFRGGKAGRIPDLKSMAGAGHRNRSSRTSFRGNDQLDEFCHASRLLINLLPDTPQTQRILNQSLFSDSCRRVLTRLTRRAVRIWWITIYWKPLDDGQIAGASLDVFATEPLPEMHPFWTHPAGGCHAAHCCIHHSVRRQPKPSLLNIERIERAQAPQGVRE